MFGWGGATRIYLAAGATDMRKGFEGLYGMARDRLQIDPLSGHVFLFANAQRNRLKLLFWDGSGLWVCAKRLEKGRFRWPESTGEETKVVLSQEELAAEVDGRACAPFSLAIMGNIGSHLTLPRGPLEDIKQEPTGRHSRDLAAALQWVQAWRRATRKEYGFWG